MDEQELGRTIFLILGRLFESDLRDVPEVDTTVAGGRGEDGLVRGRPRELLDFFLVRFEGVKLDGEVAEIPECDRLRNPSVSRVRRI